MADNVQTAAEWGQVIDNLDLTKKSVLTQLNGVRANQLAISEQLRTLSAQLSAADNAGDTALMAVIQSRIDTANRQYDSATVTAANLARDIAEIDADLNNAFFQQSQAEAGPPLDNSVTQPASSQPGDPTDVTLTDQPDVLTSRAVVSGQNPYITDETRANAAAFIAQNYPTQDTTVFYDVADPAADQIESPTPEITTFYESDGTASNDFAYPQLTPDEAALAALGDAQAGPGEASYFSPQPDDTIYYENNGASSTATPFPQLTPEEQALAALGDAQAGPGELSYPPSGSLTGLTAAKLNTNSQATQQDVNNSQQERDWRVVLSVAPGGKYLYNVEGDPGILAPLQATNGVLFPYTPQVSVTYAANYDPTELVHSNYKIYQYKGSSVDQISITCDFTAQDTFEANYLLAVIHFFRSATKMFYGKDKKPNIGSPPPLCYLNGMGAFQFNNHPLVITSFNYSLPNDVDYIRATNTTTNAGVNKSPENVPNNTYNISKLRLGPLGNTAVKWKTPAGSIEPTYVPTKMQIQISAVPVVSRNDISNKFSLTDYATGKLLRGNQNSTGGIW
jgi:hypothetical protein